jgi:hypothetical protein
MELPLIAISTKAEGAVCQLQAIFLTTRVTIVEREANTKETATRKANLRVEGW